MYQSVCNENEHLRMTPYLLSHSCITVSPLWANMDILENGRNDIFLKDVALKCFENSVK